MASTHGNVASAGSTPAPWRAAQLAALAGFGTLAWAMVKHPTVALPLFWNVIVPALPLLFLVAPGVWRGICPVATLNMWSSRSGGARHPVTPSALAGLPGILLLAVLVPARHTLLNGSGIALVALLGALAIAAVVLGRRYDAKAGFCNGVCPLLAVERLYGQRPLLDVENPRCSTCSLCTPRGCLDLAGPKAIAQTLGPARRDASWLLSAFGAFAAAFPGFVVAYFTADPASAVAVVYAHVLGWSVLSWAATTFTVLLLGLRAEPVLAVLATLAAGAYYWFAAPNAVDALGGAVAAGIALRVVLVGAVGAWGVRAVGATRRRG